MVAVAGGLIPPQFGPRSFREGNPDDRLFGSLGMFYSAALGSQAASTLPMFPAEFPTAKQHRTWSEVTVNMIKSADDPAHVAESSAIPDGRGKYKPRSLAVDDPKSWMIDGSPDKELRAAVKSDTIKFNRKVKADNVEILAQWQDHIESMRNKLAGELRVALRDNAPLLLDKLLRKHEAENGRHNGAAMMHDLLHLDVAAGLARPDDHKRTQAHYEYYPRHAAAGQCDTRHAVAARQ